LSKRRNQSQRWLHLLRRRRLRLHLHPYLLHPPHLLRLPVNQHPLQQLRTKASLLLLYTTTTPLKITRFHSEKETRLRRLSLLLKIGGRVLVLKATWVSSQLTMSKFRSKILLFTTESYIFMD
jgi:hypothetical protein